MGKTADLIALRRTVMLYKMRVKQTRLLLKRVSKSISGKLTGKAMCGKMCTSSENESSLERTVNKSQFKNFGELHSERIEAGVSASRAR